MDYTGIVRQDKGNIKSILFIRNIFVSYPSRFIYQAVNFAKTSGLKGMVTGMHRRISWGNLLKLSILA